MKLKTVSSLLAFFLLAGLLLPACRPGTGPLPTPTSLPTEPVVDPAPTVTSTNPPQTTPVSPPDLASPEAPTQPTAFWSKDLRAALAAALDREALVAGLFFNRNLPAYHMVPPGSPYSGEPFRERYGTRNLGLSNELLTRAGYSPDRPFSFELWFPDEGDGSVLAGAAREIEAQLEETGMIQVELREITWEEFNARYRSGELPAYLLSWSPDFPDVDTWLSPFASCAQSASLGSGYCNPVMEDLLTRAAAALDPGERAAIYDEIASLFAEEVPALPLYWEPDIISYREGVQGVVVGPTHEFDYSLLSFSENYEPASGSPDTIIIGTGDRVFSLDPNDAYSVHDWEILKNTGLPLLKVAPDGQELVPGAAELPEISPDGLQYNFRLKPGLTYADGSSLLAQDYVYAFQRLETLHGEISGLITQYVAGVTAPDESTVVIQLKYPAAFFPALAATTAFVPVNPAEFSLEELNPFPNELNGTGPYRMVSHEPGESMLLEKNPFYLEPDQPAIPNVLIRYFSDPVSLSRALEEGEIDIAWRGLGAVEAARLETVAQARGLVVQNVDALTLYLLVFNHTF